MGLFTSCYNPGMFRGRLRANAENGRRDHRLAAVNHREGLGLQSPDPKYILDVYQFRLGGGFVDRAKIFQSGRSQAVRLPKQFRFGGSEVFVKRVGQAVVLLPTDDAWDSLAKSLELFSDDYMAERQQPTDQQPREELP